MNLLIVGTGTMGAGIAQVAAAVGDHVFLFDRNLEATAIAVHRIDDTLSRAVTKGRISADDRMATLARIAPVESVQSAPAPDIVIEAIKEDLEIKKAVFAEIERLVPVGTVLCTNTSMLSVTTIAESLKFPNRFCGMHFFNPVPRMPLVEIIAGKLTDGKTIQAAEEAAARWGKTAVRAPDSPGFIVNRIFDAIKREALDLSNEGVDPADVDQAVRLGLNFPMGPFEVMDLIGLDTTLDVLRNQACAMGRPADFDNALTKLVAIGRLGRKSGSGFYQYPRKPSNDS